MIIALGGLLLFVGYKNPGLNTGSGGVAYDPAEDPLVNPPSLFEPPPEDRSRIATDETLYLTLRANPNTMNPIFASSGYDQIVIGPLYNGLFTFDKDMQWKVNDELVEDFEESDDHTEFIVHIKPGFTWQDGTPWTAHDVVFSWKQILDPRVPCVAQKPSVEPITECVALDAYTVRFVQAEPLATRLWNLLFPVIPKHIFARHKEEFPDLQTGEYYVRQAREPVGSGPYRFVEWKENTRIVFERWEDYKGDKPYYKQIVFRIIPDDNVALLSFEKGQVDVVDNLSAQKFALETNSEKLAEVGCKAWGVQWLFGYIGYNMDGSNPFFGDVRVRHAMTHACNIPFILDKILYNLGTVCTGNYHPESWMYNPDVELLDYNLDKARALLDEAGWKVEPETGWRYKEIDDRRVPFKFELVMPQESTTSPKIAAVFQQGLNRIGVRMTTRRMEWSSFLEKIRNHEFQAEIAAWGTGTDPDTGWNLWRTEEYEDGRNYGGYSNARVDELFAMGRREFDFEKRRKIYQEIHKIIYDDQPYTWIYYRPILAVFNKRIQGVQFSPRGIYSFSPSFEAWWTGSKLTAEIMP